MGTAAPDFALVEVPAWELRGLRWEAPCCGSRAVTLRRTLVPQTDQERPKNVPEEASFICLLWILGGG